MKHGLLQVKNDQNCFWAISDTGSSERQRSKRRCRQLWFGR